ncbi:hypothetical protein L218DRAFT_992478 [Marasmius fiardii PR-910]|nr:hypothetical protein L218DRAFT_992478 [Marasmius fiardii PR-910]
MPVSSLHPPPHPLLPNAYSPILPLERLSYPTNSEPDIEPDSVRRVYRLRIAFEGTPHFQAKSSYIGLPVAPRSRCDDLVSVVTLKLLRMNARENERKSLGVRWRRTGSSFFARFAKITPPSVFRGSRRQGENVPFVDQLHPPLSPIFSHCAPGTEIPTVKERRRSISSIDSFLLVVPKFAIVRLQENEKYWELAMDVRNAAIAGEQSGPGVNALKESQISKPREMKDKMEYSLKSSSPNPRPRKPFFVYALGKSTPLMGHDQHNARNIILVSRLLLSIPTIRAR